MQPSLAQPGVLLVCCWPHSDRADHHGQHGGLADCGLRSAVTHRKLAALLWHRVNHRHAPLEVGVLLLAVRGWSACVGVCAATCGAGLVCVCVGACAATCGAGLRRSEVSLSRREVGRGVKISHRGDLVGKAAERTSCRTHRLAHLLTCSTY